MVKGIGVDIIDIPRFRGVLSKWRGRVIHRLFSMTECEYCMGKKDPAPHFAVRFAAKEAFVKAMGTGFGSIALPRDIEVVIKRSGNPFIRVSGKTQVTMKTLGADSVHLSLSHEREMGIAMVVLEGKDKA